MEIDDVVDDVIVIIVSCPNNYIINCVVYIVYLLVVLTTGHIDVGTSVDAILQSMLAVEPLVKAYDPCGQGVHGLYPVLE